MSSGYGDHDGLIHQALLYDGDEDFVATLAPFCSEGLARGERVFAVTTPGNIALLRDALGGRAGGVEFTVADEWYRAPGRTLGAYSRYVDEHKAAHGRVRVIGEPVWLGRSAEAEAEWTRYESVVNVAFASSPAWIVCPYDRRMLPEHIVAYARRTHPVLLMGEGPRASEVFTDPAAFVYEGDELPLPAPPDVAGSVLDVDFDADLALLRGRVAEYAAGLGLPGERVELLLVVVNELAANSVQYGGGGGRFRLWARRDDVVCDVIDDGRMLEAFPGYLPPSASARRGHGLWVVRQICDLVQIRTDPLGTQVRVYLSRA